MSDLDHLRSCQAKICRRGLDVIAFSATIEKASRLWEGTSTMQGRVTHEDIVACLCAGAFSDGMRPACVVVNCQLQNPSVESGDRMGAARSTTISCMRLNAVTRNTWWQGFGGLTSDPTVPHGTCSNAMVLYENAHVPCQIQFELHTVVRVDETGFELHIAVRVDETGLALERNPQVISLRFVGICVCIKPHLISRVLIFSEPYSITIMSKPFHSP